MKKIKCKICEGTGSIPTRQLETKIVDGFVISSYPDCAECEGKGYILKQPQEASDE